ncbi:hypothetical protein BD289DRAFT_486750 [Coniella lustricola]|uniref:Uncharacterized protein n=1 Tax=Coniella lustricola TaxID=2025994 RepID=A0A2T2ZU18_9PEZI|nr:hypothetical protein BD289DRAFT_486750 [Coniella lustricola]
MDESRLAVAGPSLNLGLLDFGLAALRVSQWTSSLLAYASLDLLDHHSRVIRFAQNERLRVVQLLSFISLLYATLVICGVHICKTLHLRRVWRVCAVVSLPGDLAMMGICLANVTLLASSGLPADCHGFTRPSYEQDGLLRQQPTTTATGFETIRLGSWPAAGLSPELDRFCAFPRTVYGLSVLAM